MNQLYMICAAKITQENWNKPGYTFIVTTDEGANWLSIDCLVLTDFLDRVTTSVSFYSNYLNLFVNNQSFLDIEVLEQSEDNEDEYVNEAIFTAHEDLLEMLNKSTVKNALLESLRLTPSPKDSFRREVVEVISASLTQIRPQPTQ